MRPPVVAWVDPGLMTGLAVIYPDDTLWTGEGDFLTAGDWINDLARGCAAQLLLGIERYLLIPGAPLKDAHHAIEMIGVARRAAMEHGCQLAFADPADRLVITMAMLKPVGLWLPRLDDSQSASQHLVAWLKRSGNLPPSMAARMSEAPGKV